MCARILRVAVSAKSHFLMGKLKSLKSRLQISALRMNQFSVARRISIPSSIFASLAVVLFLVPAISFPASSAISGVTTLCSSIGDPGAGIYPGTGGAFVEGWSSGNLYSCSGGSSKLIAKVPSGAPSLGYFGMGGIKTATSGLVLILTNTNGGLWICKHATASGCGSKSKYITLDPAFCLAEAAGFCNPDGTAVDKSLNLYYVDSANVQFVECTASSHYQACAVLPASSSLSGAPSGLFMAGNTFYVSDGSCNGMVWMGSKTTLFYYAHVTESLQGIAVSSNNPSKTPHVYVTYEGTCSNTVSGIYDVTDGKLLPTPFNSATQIGDVDSKLQFTTFNPGMVYQTTDIS